MKFYRYIKNKSNENVNHIRNVKMRLWTTGEKKTKIKYSRWEFFSYAQVWKTSEAFPNVRLSAVHNMLATRFREVTLLQIRNLPKNLQVLLQATPNR